MGLFKLYNQRDVEVEMQIHKRLQNYPVPDLVWDEYHISEEINDRGILIDRQLVDNAIRMSEITQEHLSEKMKNKTGLDNPNSVAQLKGWLSDNDVETDSLGKKDVAKLIPEAPDEVAEVLRLRQQSSKSSIKKYVAMDTAACNDNRCRGMFSFYGANRTGRFAGRIVQLQNLYRNSMPDLAEARELVRQGDYESLDMLYDNIPDVLSQLIRTSFIPKPGYKYVVSDFSAIEARVLSFLAGEQWRLDVFANNGDIYCESASHMFGVPVVKHGINGELRQKGKIAELALGYGGSVGALKAMGAIGHGPFRG
jgi:DNA polymerase